VSGPLFANALVSGLLLAGFYAAVSVGISISFGMLDVVNIAHPGFIILGSYAASIANSSIGADPIVTAVALSPAFFTLGLLLYRLYHASFERRGREPLRGLAFFFGILFVTEVALILAFGGGLTWYAAGGVGLEARVDTADVSVRSVDAIVRVRFPLPPPLPSLSTDVNIPATADLQRLRPVSLNLAARTPGNVKVRVSGGVSYLPSLRFSVRSDIRAAGPLVANLPLAHLLVRAEAQPGGEGESRLGFNAGAGVAWPLSGRLSLEVDARYFRFRRQTLAWTADPGVPLTPVEQQLMRELLVALAPVSFNPEFFQATGGLSLRF